MITLFCDASFCSETGAAGWGAWVIGDGMRQGELFGGAFRERMPSSTDAEMCAIANALSQRAPPYGVVMVQSDCERALRVIASRVRGAQISNHATGHQISTIQTTLTPMERMALDVIGNYERLIVRHVYGHMQGSRRFWVNRQCDRIARDAMRTMRRELRDATE